MDPALAVPENEGVLSLVILSTFEAPLSEEEPRSGANGLDLFGSFIVAVKSTLICA